MTAWEAAYLRQIAAFHHLCSTSALIMTASQLAYLHEVLHIDLLLLRSGECHKELGEHALHLEGLQDKQVQWHSTDHIQRNGIQAKALTHHRPLILT